MFAGKKKWIAGAAVVIALVAGAARVAVATGANGDDDQPVTGTILEKATTAALAHTRGGTVTETEAGDDGAAYSVEVRLSDGRVVEVNLDANFNVIGQEDDDDTGETEGRDDD